jgi:ribosome maturation protein SDO1
MVKLEDAVIARLEKFGEKFEILVDPNLAMNVKRGEEVDFNELLASDTIFKDSGKGTEQSPEAINKVFNTTNPAEVAKKIILTGDVQLTTDQRKEMREKKFKEVVQIISRNAVNPQTNAPHPPQRIENALQELGIQIDPQKSAQEQVPELIKALKPIIPISFEKIQFAVKIPSQFAAKAYSVLKNFEVKKEQWQNDGSLVAVLEIPAGLKTEVLSELNHITHGDLESKILEEK